MRTLLLFLSILLYQSVVHAKEFHIEEVKVEALWKANGELQIKEYRTYRFDGTYSWATYRLRRKSFKDLKDVKVSEDGLSYTQNKSGEKNTFRVKKKDSDLELKWFFSASNEVRTFVLEYTVTDMGTYGLDTDMLYWTFISSRFKKPVQLAEVHLRFESPLAECPMVWVSGNDAQHSLEVDSQHIYWKGERLHSNEGVTMKILLSEAWSKGVKRKTSITHASLLSEQLKKMDDEIAWLETQEALSPWADKIRTLVLFGSLAFFIGLYQRYGKREELKQAIPRIIESPPTNTPAALVMQLMNGGYYDSRCIMFTIMELSQKGYFVIRGEAHEKPSKPQTFFLRRTSKTNLDGLFPFEQACIQWMDELLQGEERPFKAVFGTDNKHWAKQLQTWSGLVKQDLKAQQWFNEESGKRAIMHGLLQGLVFIPMAIASVIFAPVHILMNVATIVVPVLMLFASFALRIKTEKGEWTSTVWKQFLVYIKSLRSLKQDGIKPEVYFLYALIAHVRKKDIQAVLDNSGLKLSQVSWLESEDLNMDFVVMTSHIHMMMFTSAGAGANGMPIGGGAGVSGAGGASGGGAG